MTAWYLTVTCECLYGGDELENDQCPLELSCSSWRSAGFQTLESHEMACEDDHRVAGVPAECTCVAENAEHCGGPAND